MQVHVYTSGLPQESTIYKVLFQPYRPFLMKHTCLRFANASMGRLFYVKRNSWTKDSIHCLNAPWTALKNSTITLYR